MGRREKARSGVPALVASHASRMASEMRMVDFYAPAQQQQILAELPI